MILNHVWGLYAHPRKTWQLIQQRHEGLVPPAIHLLLIALIPVLCAYYASTHLGWHVAPGKHMFIAKPSAFIMASFMYLGLVLTPCALAYITTRLGQVYIVQVTYSQALAVLAYAATPVYMAGLAALNPQLWFIACVFLGGLAYSIYLLYSGLPTLFSISAEHGFVYASAVLMVSLIFLVALVMLTIIAWTNGLTPNFLH
ncbi:hypothetical protein CWE15_00925 [Aliidiomarina taiwanensis]|uniref:Yip1 domain-containing protein n=1 Tax=Aliidiomarina taiwanensis TaxID=946228 RepID=A0A432X8P4_9GAMM|nr:Yip1 family protein [Aliidiomarina taiwanensis]RUO43795.1 hypothetical protein CWE15_00925 [Aliidiomarina taiwanensis]